MPKVTAKGKLEVICGSMFSGKSEELIRRLRRAEFAQLNVQVFKHTLDNRKTTDHVHAHNGNKLAAIAAESPESLETLTLASTDIIGIDEVQFFPNDIVPVIQKFIEKGKRVIAAGLDLDFKGVPFGCMPILLALADSVTKLQAVCTICGEDAHFTQRLVNGRPAKYNDPIIIIGAQECYQARCRNCHKLDLKNSY
jgi:thymidine kinase